MPQEETLKLSRYLDRTSSYCLKKLQSPTYPFNTFLVASEKKNSKNYFFPRVMALGRYGNCGPWPSSSIPWKGPGTNLGSPSPPTSPHLISLRSTQSAKYWYFEGSELRLLKGSKHVLSWVVVLK